MNLPEEKRTSQRIQVAIPVYLGQEKTVTRDISWSGIYFLTSQKFSERKAFDFCIDLNYALPGKPVKLKCQGRVVRIEPMGKYFGIGAKINTFRYLH